MAPAISITPTTPSAKSVIRILPISITAGVINNVTIAKVAPSRSILRININGKSTVFCNIIDDRAIAVAIATNTNGIKYILPFPRNLSIATIPIASLSIKYDIKAKTSAIPNTVKNCQNPIGCTYDNTQEDTVIAAAIPTNTNNKS